MRYIIKSTDFVLGSFSSIEKLKDRYKADNTEIQFSTVDPCTIEEVPDDWVNPAVIAQQNAQYNNDQKQKRAECYRQESDALFFKAQRGEATLEEWEAKVEEIKLRYPYKV